VSALTVVPPPPPGDPDGPRPRGLRFRLWKIREAAGTLRWRLTRAVLCRLATPPMLTQAHRERPPCRVVELAGRRLLAAAILVLVLTVAGSFALSRPAGHVYNPNQSWALWQCHIRHQPLPSCVLASEGPVMKP
jgi:hypothetical protein